MISRFGTRKKKKKNPFFSSLAWMTVDFFWYWSPHMDYPGDSVIALASTLVGLFHAKNGIWFRLFLAEIIFVTTRIQVVLFRCFSHVVGWVWLPSTCDSAWGIRLSRFELAWRGPVMWPSRKRRCLFYWQSDCLQSLAGMFVFAFVLDNKFACFAMQPVCT